jgi:TM2 domain-containing membrane protein YozV
MKNKGTVVLLCFFLGGIGGHKFYLNKTGIGIFYFLFCWTFIPGIIAFFEGVKFLMMNENEFNRIYNYKTNYVNQEK